MMLLLLLLLLMLLEYIRVTGRKFSRCSTVEEDVTQLLAAVGFQVSENPKSFPILVVTRTHMMSELNMI